MPLEERFELLARRVDRRQVPPTQPETVDELLRIQRLDGHAGGDLQARMADVEGRAWWGPRTQRRQQGRRGFFFYLWRSLKFCAGQCHPRKRPVSRLSVGRRPRLGHGPQLRDRRADRLQVEGSLRVGRHGLAVPKDARGRLKVPEDHFHNPVGAGLRIDWRVGSMALRIAAI